MTFYKVVITKEFIEETGSEFDAENEALLDMMYNIDGRFHTPASIRKNVKIETRPLTEGEYKELERAMKK